MTLFAWFNKKSIDFPKVFGAANSESANRFYDARVLSTKDLYLFWLVISPPIRDFFRDFGLEEKEPFTFLKRPIRLPNSWMVADHVGIETRSIQIGKNHEVLFDIDGKSLVIAKNFSEFTKFMETDSTGVSQFILRNKP